MSESGNKVINTVRKWVSDTYQLDRLERLCQGSIFLRVAYSGLIGNIDYAMTHEKAGDDNAAIVIADIRYPFTLEGRKAAIAESFRHFSNKCDAFLSVQNVATIIGSIDFLSDIATAGVPKTNYNVIKQLE